MSPTRGHANRLAALAVVVVAVGACGDDGGGGDTPESVTLVTHDAFLVSDGIFEQFEAETGVEVEVLVTSDTGTMVSEAVLTAGNPVGDVLYGIDNTFLQRGLDADLFEPHRSGLLGTVPETLRLDDEFRVTPIDFADVCVNYWIDEVGTPPSSIADLAEPEYAGAFVTPNPETSSPGFAFLLATIATFGEDGWEDYWSALRANEVDVATSWTDAYLESFTAGGGDRPIVTSYATSPVAEVVFAEPRPDEPPTGVITESCFRQIEFAGVLRGTDAPDVAAELVDFLLSERFQEDMPLNMFVFPANSSASVPPEFVEYAAVAENPLTIAPETIEANRAAWTDRWTEIVLR